MISNGVGAIVARHRRRQEQVLLSQAVGRLRAHLGQTRRQLIMRRKSCGVNSLAGDSPTVELFARRLAPGTDSVGLERSKTEADVRDAVLNNQRPRTDRARGEYHGPVQRCRVLIEHDMRGPPMVKFVAQCSQQSWAC